MKILQVFALTGLGHLREAKSIKRALDNADIENEILDILHWADTYNLYTKVAVLPLKVFKWFFEVTTKYSSSFNVVEPPLFSLKLIMLFFRIAEVPLGFALRQYLKNCEYDTFIAVHPWALGAIWSFGLGKNICSNLVNVIPDEIDPGSASFYAIPGGKNGPIHMVNSIRVKELFEFVGVDPNRIDVIGHTLDPIIYDNRNEIYKRVQKKLSNKNSILTLGLLIGGTGTLDEQIRIKEIIKSLANEIKQGRVRVKVLPGPHLVFATELQNLIKELELDQNKNIEIFSALNKESVIDKGHVWLRDEVDVLFAKTGEIIFYSLGSGIPHINFPPKGSNEVYHLNFMRSLNAIYNYDDIKNLSEFINNRDLLLSLSSNAFNAKYQLNGAKLLAEWVTQNK